MKTVYVYDVNNHQVDTPCPQKWFWCRIHWWPRFESTGEKWYEPYPLTVNRKTSTNGWSSVTVYCGPGTFYPKPATNRSYRKEK
jgi:hypothetical protein